MEARAYTPLWRTVSALLLALSRGSLLVLFVLLLFFETRLTNPLRLIRVFAQFFVIPEFAAWLIARAFQVTLRTDEETLVIDEGRRLIEIPFDSIDRIEPWSMLLPGHGVWLRLKSGNRFLYGLEVANPVTLIDAVADAREGEPPSSPRAQSVAYAGEEWRWYHAALKFPLFALVPTLPLFRLHQWITYGGTFGEYYTYGLQAYLLAFFIYWANTTIWLVVYAAGLRAVVEPLVLACAYAVPSQARTARRVAEAALSLLYYGGVAAFLLRLYLLSRQ